MRDGRAAALPAPSPDVPGYRWRRLCRLWPYMAPRHPMARQYADLSVGLAVKKRAGWWWIDRWRKSTAYTDMTAEQQGVYRNLLDELWLRDGLLPLDERALVKISGDPEAWPRVRGVVLARFRKTPDGYRNDTHDEVAAGTAEAIERQREKGRRRAEKASRGQAGRFQPHQPDVQPDHQPETSHASSRRLERGNQPSGSGSGSVQPEQEQVGTATSPACLPPADQTERTIRESTDALRTKLYGLVAQMVKADPQQRDPTQLMRLVTGYEAKDGRQVPGVVNAGMLTFERLEKSIADAEWQLEDWRTNGTGTPAAVKR